jgi:hypothetical protein
VPRRRETGTRKGGCCDAGPSFSRLRRSFRMTFVAPRNSTPPSQTPGFPPRQAKTTPVRGPRARRGPRVLRGTAFLARRVGTNKDFVKSATRRIVQGRHFLLDPRANKW